MMPDLGKYAVEVTLAYGVTLAILTALIWASVARSRRVKRTLEASEKANRDG